MFDEALKQARLAVDDLAVLTRALDHLVRDYAALGLDLRRIMTLDLAPYGGLTHNDGLLRAQSTAAEAQNQQTMLDLAFNLVQEDINGKGA